MIVFCNFISANIGSYISFFIGRKLLRNCIKKLFVSRVVFVNALEKSIEVNALKMIVLCRLSPIVPANYFNYFLSVTKCTFRQLMIGGIAMAPMEFLYCYVGINLGSVKQILDGEYSMGPLYIFGVFIGFLLLFGICWVLARESKREINKIIEQY